MSSIPDSCYIHSGGSVILTTDLSPCGVTNSTNPQVPCCWKGDTCLSDGICTYTHSLDGGSGYVAAGCTDQGFGDGCRSLCAQNTYGDIVYVESSKTWHCCSFPPDGIRNCSQPLSDQFLAPAPKELLTIQALPKTGTPSYVVATVSSTPTSTPSGISTSASSTTSTAAPSTTSSTSNTSTPSTSGGLSTGAKAGIGVGAGIAAVGIMGLIGFLLFRRRRRQPYATDTNVHELAQPPTYYANQTKYAELQGPIAEKDARTGPVELGTTER
ncbi:hypothetical protein BU24DRAFT_424601 [Aaosphaeria arxii CBS 175.79]|uniref:Mid2 domain-containing protein n=1 Tax=Aaosphaeria arxii CBS 175.79 TaxID=1450172 RepID=A0A6A5XKE2_9PLEO|nr:uncharacterized protein BU24DRAFT_424601 [Aaosphaeria arxii CBS 175.79]KAF2013602.1 hypothetical protein BU24DRAFT_424601 [Aaosphaeria arxii CBS 175.79]